MVSEAVGLASIDRIGFGSHGLRLIIPGNSICLSIERLGAPVSLHRKSNSSYEMRAGCGPGSRLPSKDMFTSVGDRNRMGVSSWSRVSGAWRVCQKSKSGKSQNQISCP